MGLRPMLSQGDRRTRLVVRSLAVVVVWLVRFPRRRCVMLSYDVYSDLRSLAWRYRCLRRHRGADRHLVFVALSREVERLAGDRPQAVGEIHEALYYLLQDRM